MYIAQGLQGWKNGMEGFEIGGMEGTNRQRCDGFEQCISKAAAWPLFSLRGQPTLLQGMELNENRKPQHACKPPRYALPCLGTPPKLHAVQPRVKVVHARAQQGRFIVHALPHAQDHCFLPTSWPILSLTGCHLVGCKVDCQGGQATACMAWCDHGESSASIVRSACSLKLVQL